VASAVVPVRADSSKVGGRFQWVDTIVIHVSRWTAGTMRFAVCSRLLISVTVEGRLRSQEENFPESAPGLSVFAFAIRCLGSRPRSRRISPFPVHAERVFDNDADVQF